MDFFRCGLLEETGCALPDSPCSGVSGGTDVGLSTPAPATPDESQDAPPAAPSTIMPTETVTITVPAPVENVPLPSTPSLVDDVDRDAVATSGGGGGFVAPSRSCWSSYCSVVLLVGGWIAAAAAAAAGVGVVL